MMELMDQASINAVEDYRPMGLDRAAGALLIAQSDAPGAACAAEIEIMEAACRPRAPRRSSSPTTRRRARCSSPPGGPPSRRSRPVARILLEDVGAPIPLLPELLAADRRRSLRRTPVEIPVVAHAGDGNTHPIVVFDPNDPSARDRARPAFDEIMPAAIALGGTITGEHGVGRTKKGALPDQLGPDVMALSRTIKNALDPDGILNPGAVL